MHLVLGAVHVLLAAQATLMGTVRDAGTAQPLPGVAVTLTDLDRATATDSAGRYALSEVPPGPQHLSIRCLGYAPRILHAFVPSAGSLQIDVALDPEPVRLEGIEVRAPVPVRGLEPAGTRASADREVSIAAVRNDPMLAEPDGIEALGGGDIALRPESPDGVHILGGASDQTSYSLDGVPIFSPFHAAGMTGAWNPDALSRLELTSWTPSPEGQRALCGGIDASTREPGERVSAEGSATTTHARLTLDG